MEVPTARRFLKCRARLLTKLKQRNTFGLINISFGCDLGECQLICGFRFVCFILQIRTHLFQVKRTSTLLVFQPGTENVPHLELVGGIGGCRFSGRGTASKQQGLKAPCPGQTFIFPPLPPLDASKVQAKQLTGSARLIIVCAVSIQAIKIFLNVRCFSDKAFFFFFSPRELKPGESTCGELQFCGA